MLVAVATTPATTPAATFLPKLPLPIWGRTDMVGVIAAVANVFEVAVAAASANGQEEVEDAVGMGVVPLLAGGGYGEGGSPVTPGQDLMHAFIAAKAPSSLRSAG